MNAAQNRILITLVAALLVPWVERLTGVKLTDDQVAGLVALAAAAAHGIAAVFVRYFPPKVPTTPAGPAKG